jgi:hypothetical protein
VFLHVLKSSPTEKCTIRFAYADEEITETTNIPIEEDKPIEEVREEPYTLPSGFQWDTLDINDPIVVSKQISTQLC